MKFSTPGSPQLVIERARNVLLPLVDLESSAFSDGAAHRLLPAWFMEMFSRQPLPGQSESVWDIDGWLGWIDPEERPWRWWNAYVLTKDLHAGTVEIQIDDWPTPVAALSWLLLASGADATEYIE